MKRKMQPTKGVKGEEVPKAKHIKKSSDAGDKGSSVDLSKFYGSHANPKKPGADAKPKKALSKAKQKALENKII